MQVIRNYSGIPQPSPHEGPPLHLQTGDIVELIRGEAHSLFWQVELLTPNIFVLLVRATEGVIYLCKGQPTCMSPAQSVISLD